MSFSGGADVETGFLFPTNAEFPFSGCFVFVSVVFVSISACAEKKNENKSGASQLRLFPLHFYP
jgi:hypothetical protein